MPRQNAAAPPLLLAAAALTWPALLNGYPLVFSDSGTYLSQALNRYLGWDRPVFYSFFMLPLHLGVTTWPVVAAQAILAAWVLSVACRVLTPERSPWWATAVAAVLSLASSLPWFAAQLMPDLFTGLLILVMALLVLAPERLGRLETWGLAGLAAFAMAAHLSSLPLALGLLAILLPLRRRLGARAPFTRAGLVRVLGAPAAAALALAGVNLVGHGKAAVAPYGNIFLLARVIYDGPGRDALARDCPAAGWRLCAVRGRLPATADDFLWLHDGPLNAAGGPKPVSAEADAIIAAAVRAEPEREASAFLGNTVRQLGLFGSGDGLHAWPDTVSPWIRRDFPPFEQAAYAVARQTAGRPLLPRWMAVLHTGAAVAGVAVSLLCLPGLLRRRALLGGVVVAVAAGLLGNAAITGGLSGPHARYQSRVMWLPVFTALLIAGDRRKPAS